MATPLILTLLHPSHYTLKITNGSLQSWAPQIYTQFRNRKFRKTARGVPQPQIRKFAIGLR